MGVTDRHHAAFNEYVRRAILDNGECLPDPLPPVILGSYASARRHHVCPSDYLEPS